MLGDTVDPRVTVTRHETALGDWTSARWVPAKTACLAGAVDHIWYFDGTLTAARERVFPDGTLEIIVQLDTPHRPGSGTEKRPFPPVCVTGLRTTAETVEAPPGRCRVLGIRLHPFAASAVLEGPLHELTSRTVDLHDAIGRAAAELATRAHAARDPAVVVTTAAGWVARRLADHGDAQPAAARVLHGIVAGHGAQTIAALDAWSGRSRSRVAAAFRDRVGVSPKRFARIVRFDRALNAVAQTRASLGEIALAAGYYDQAHFAAEFREHAGLTARAFLRATRYPSSNSIVDDS